MALVLDLLVCVVGLVVFAQHVWALRGHFASTSMAGGAKVISFGALSSCAIMLILTWWVDQPVFAQVLGIILMPVSLILFWQAIRASRAASLRYAFDTELPRQLVTDGPYRYIRHPFYSSYLIFWTGWAIATWSIWAVVPIIAMAILYTSAARYEEKRLGESEMGRAYALYRKQAGLFWPRFPARS